MCVCVARSNDVCVSGDGVCGDLRECGFCDCVLSKQVLCACVIVNCVVGLLRVNVKTVSVCASLCDVVDGVFVVWPPSECCVAV